MSYEAPTIRLLGSVADLTQTNYVEMVVAVGSVTDTTTQPPRPTET